jgi:RNA polymerase sigma-70 factor (ECF subfamily)
VISGVGGNLDCFTLEQLVVDVRISIVGGDVGAVIMSTRAVEKAEALGFLDRAMPEVYGYLLHRTQQQATAEDLTSETMLAAVTTLARRAPDDLSVAWLIGIARHKLVDHWRRQARERRHLELMSTDAVDEVPPDEFEPGRASATLAMLNPSQRMALTLRYVDGLSVAEVAVLVDRSLHATETLLARARATFRDRYREMDQADA